DHAAFRPTQSTIREKSTRLDTGSTLSALTLQETPANVSDPDPLSYVKPQSIPEWEINQYSKGANVAGDPDSEKSTFFTSFTGSPIGIYQPGWGMTNSCHLESPDVCQEVVDHRVAMGSQLRLRFEQEVRLLKRATKKGLHNQMKNLEALLEAELSQQVSSLQAQIIGEEQVKAAFKEFKRYEDDKVEQRCAEMDACLDKLSIDFDEEL
ncbi:hypothetical protein Tco_0069804, partial [Tanacetum coccineum]